MIESALRWREGTHQSKRTRVSLGTTFRFTLNVPAQASLTFSREVAGRLVRGQCVAPSAHYKNGRACARTIQEGSLSVAGRAGFNRLPFVGRLSASQQLPPGRYDLTITATNADGQSAAQRLRLTIVA